MPDPLRLHGDGERTAARSNSADNSGSDSGAYSGSDFGSDSCLPNPSFLRGLLLSYAPAALSPALWAFATAPERLTWTTQVSSRIFSAVSTLYDELTEVDGYGEALEQALLDLRGVPVRILDVATGTGYAARRLKRQYPRAEVIGVDASPEMVAIARHNAEAEDLDIQFEVGDAARLGFEDASFDLVVSQNAPPFCDEMLRLLRPRGKAVLVYSFGGPWVELAWSPIARRLERSGASHARGKRAGFGFYGIARKRG
ncbi:MAG: class I SAM-dependent methyltransferase [Actinobacteria bacterium]|nr:MAG: class I SAM-dependent methyltransferase [Actinomycetota bacterium]